MAKIHLPQELKKFGDIFDTLSRSHGTYYIFQDFLDFSINAWSLNHQADMDTIRKKYARRELDLFNEHISGSSIQKRSRAHQMANKTMKKQLHMCALAAVRHDPEMKAYYERKAGEGKNKMLVLNNVRNKLVLRVCAVVKRQTPYQKSVA